MEAPVDLAGQVSMLTRTVADLQDRVQKLEGTVKVGEAISGSKADVVCSHRGTRDELSGDCECFAAYTSSDGNNSFGLREDCGVMLSSGWVAGK